jgi:hypothetical protein
VDDAAGSLGHALITSVGVTALLTSVFALKFRYWRRPGVLAIYAAFFFALEWVGHRYMLPEGVFGPWLGYLCLLLTCPVVVSIYLLDRYEKKMGVAD